MAETKTHKVTLIPGDGMICFDAHFPVAGGGGTCQPDATVNAGQVLISGFNDTAPNLQGIAGIVPDGVTTVTITAANEPAQSLSVYENVYMTEIALGSFTVSFNGPNGPVTLGANPPNPVNTNTSPANGAPAP